MKQLHALYSSMCPAFYLFRCEMIELLSTLSKNAVQSCEFAYIKQLIYRNLWLLFDEETRNKPAVNTDPWAVSPNGLLGIGDFLLTLEEPLLNIESALLMISSSVALDILSEMLKRDANYYLYVQKQAKDADKSKNTNTNTNAINYAYPINKTPRLISELLGYIIARHHKKDTWSPVLFDPNQVGSKTGDSFAFISPTIEDEHIFQNKRYLIWELHAALVLCLFCSY